MGPESVESGRTPVPVPKTRTFGGIQMHPARWTRTSLVFAIFALSACGEPLSPLSAGKALGRGVNASGAVQTHLEFDVFDDNDIPLSCLNGEMTHWGGSVPRDAGHY